MAKSTKATKVMSKTELVAALMERTGATKAMIVKMLDALVGIAAHELAAGGMFRLHGLASFKLVHKPATPARDGINPFTKQPQHFSAKPAKDTIKSKPMKALTDAVKPRK